MINLCVSFIRVLSLSGHKIHMLLKISLLFTSQSVLMGNTIVYNTWDRGFEPHWPLNVYFCHKVVIIWWGIFFQMGFNLKKAPWRPLGGLPWEKFCVSFCMWYKAMQKSHLSTEKLLVTLINLKLWDFIPPNNTPRYPMRPQGPLVF